MANKKEVIQWVEIQINKKMKMKKVSDVNFYENIENIVKEHIKDPIYRYFINNALHNNSRYDEDLRLYVPSISDKVRELCVEAKIYDSVINILNEVDVMYANYKAETDEISEYNDKLRDLLASFKEGMLLISNGDLADYAKAFIESVK